jgi:membrane protein DedA with SNARE-associated domain
VFFEHFSYAGISLLLILTGLGLPIPEEVIIVVAGVLSGNGTLDPWYAWAACFLGAMAGDTATYAVGHHFGHRLIRERSWFSRLITPARERRIEKMIQEHGIKVFVLARFMIGVRSAIYLTAGILRVPFRRFMLVNTTCAAVIITAFFGASYVFGAQFQAWFQMIRQAELALTIAVVAAVVGIGVYFLVRHRRRVARIRQRWAERRQAKQKRASSPPIDEKRPVA